MICEKCEALSALIDGYRRERDEAVEAFRDATRLRSEIQQARIKAENERDEARASVADAYRRGAEAMREAAANALDMAGQGTLCDTSACDHWGRYVRALPIPEEP
jgi:hypothetical protein